MKQFLFLLIVLSSSIGMKAQNPSDCTVPYELSTFYERDIKSLALKRMEQLNSSDRAFIRIPKAWQDTIAQGMAAILQANFAESDSVFNFYCVHDNTSPLQIYNGLLIQVDLSYPWTQAWQNLNTLTGNAYIDTLTSRYHLEVSEFFDWSFADYALLHTDSLWNIYALIDSLVIEPGIISGEPNALIGTAGKIVYDKIGENRYYDFYFQFNDCFDGCDNYHKWKFKVNEDCPVEYLGFEDFGFFGIEPLPPAVNCNIYTSLSNQPEQSSPNVYPNPTEGYFWLELDSFSKYPVGFEIFNILGSSIATGRIEEENQVINISDLPTGLYFIKTENSKTPIIKLLKK